MKEKIKKGGNPTTMLDFMVQSTTEKKTNLKLDIHSQMLKNDPTPIQAKLHQMSVAEYIHKISNKMMYIFSMRLTYQLTE